MPNTSIWSDDIYNIVINVDEEAEAPTNKHYAVINKHTSVYEYAAFSLIECISFAEQSTALLSDRKVFTQAARVMSIATKATH